MVFESNLKLAETDVNDNEEIPRETRCLLETTSMQGVRIANELDCMPFCEALL